MGFATQEFCSIYVLMNDMTVIWLKRDLRLHDHAALNAACASDGAVLALYIFEPEYWRLPEHSERQFDFLVESLKELDVQLKARGGRLCIRVGGAVDVFSALHTRHGIAAIHSHEDTGLQWSFERDKAVRRWARRAGVPVREHGQHGINADLEDQDVWQGWWTEQMSKPRLTAPEQINSADISSDPWPLAEDFGLGGPDCPQRQRGGRREGVAMLRTFLTERGRTYRADMDDPTRSETSCSRLSPHLAFGTVSMREAWQGAAKARICHAKAGDTKFVQSVDNFVNRLTWHCRALQTVEQKTTLAGRALLTGGGDDRPIPSLDDPRLNAWRDGRTGFPFIDACMRALRETGWLNFQMRSMLMAFAANQLWMDWVIPATQLGALFTDFEAGLHYPQARRQSGVNQRNQPQIANPVRQSKQLDPSGAFIRRWVPELAHLPDMHIHAPWDAPKSALAAAGIVFGQTYPMRIVDHVAAAREAREKMRAAHTSSRARPSAHKSARQTPPTLSGVDTPLPVNAVRSRARHTRKDTARQLSLDLFAPTHLSDRKNPS